MNRHRQIDINRDDRHTVIMRFRDIQTDTLPLVCILDVSLFSQFHPKVKESDISLYFSIYILPFCTCSHKSKNI